MDLADALLADAARACVEVAPVALPVPRRTTWCMDRGDPAEATLERARRCAVEAPGEPAALDVLRVLGDPRDVPLLASAAMVPRAGPVAADALAAIGTGPARDALYAVACRAEGRAAGHALDALERLDDPRVAPLLLAHAVTASGEAARDAARRLGRRGDEAVWTALDRLPDPVVATVGFANDPDPHGGGTRRLLARPAVEVVHPMVEAGHPRARELVLELLAARDEEVRIRIAFALGRARDGALADLWRQVIDAEDPHLAVAALAGASAEARAGTEEIDERLIALVGGPAGDAARDALYGGGAVLGAHRERVLEMAREDWRQGRGNLARVARVLSLSEPDRAELEEVAAAGGPRATFARAALGGFRPFAAPTAPAAAAHVPERVPTADAKEVRRRALRAGDLGLLGVVGGPSDREALVAGLSDPDRAHAALRGLWSLGAVDVLDAVRADADAPRAVRSEAARLLDLPTEDPGWLDSLLRGVADGTADPRPLLQHPYGRAGLVALEPTLPREVRDRVRQVMVQAQWAPLPPPEPVRAWARVAGGVEGIALLADAGEPERLVAALRAKEPRALEAIRRVRTLPPAAATALLASLDVPDREGRLRTLLALAASRPETRAALGDRLLAGEWPGLRPSERGALLVASGTPIPLPILTGLLAGDPSRTWLDGVVAPEGWPALRDALLALDGGARCRLPDLAPPDELDATLLLLLQQEDVSCALAQVARREEPVADEVIAAIEALGQVPAFERDVVDALARHAPDRAIARVAARGPGPTDLRALQAIGTDAAAELAAALLARADEPDALVDHAVEAAARWLRDRGGPVAERHAAAIAYALSPRALVVRP